MTTDDLRMMYPEKQCVTRHCRLCGDDVWRDSYVLWLESELMKQLKTRE